MEDVNNNESRKYTSFELMNTFGIKKGSWAYIKEKLELDKYGERVIIGKKEKFLYSQEAFDILKEEYKTKIVKEVQENPKMAGLVERVKSFDENMSLKDDTITTLKATLDEYKNISSKFEKMYNDEKEAKEKIIEESHQKDLKIVEITKDYEQIKKLYEEEKNKGFFKKIFGRTKS